ncbi:hypothetical protein IWQ60_004294 [Tieghemiomyces parasiticus]|uniref:START domain-containing protein n=1 Tax=Tieghemiomyces parasiticus TaxID=78921 RepID=A0A9W8DVM9_9FUNG|nr:hypothetical protein IWQ60_004294 [Tieghemiomyces parasiticus]
MATFPATHPIFKSLTAELAGPDLEGWEPFRDLHQFQFYRRPYTGANPYGLVVDQLATATDDTLIDLATSTTTPPSVTPAADGVLYEYKVIGVFADVDARTLDRVYTDLDYRKSWDINMLRHTDLGHGQFSYAVKYPFPLTNREYIYRIAKHTTEDTTGRPVYVTLGASLTVEGNYSGLPGQYRDPHTQDPPPLKGSTRIQQYFQALVLASLPSSPGCQVLMHYFEDPDGNIPAFLVNWVIKAGVPAFIKNLRDACLRYKPRP